MLVLPYIHVQLVCSDLEGDWLLRYIHMYIHMYTYTYLSIVQCTVIPENNVRLKQYESSISGVELYECYYKNAQRHFEHKKQIMCA